MGASFWPIFKYILWSDYSNIAAKSAPHANVSIRRLYLLMIIDNFSMPCKHFIIIQNIFSIKLKFTWRNLALKRSASNNFPGHFVRSSGGESPTLMKSLEPFDNIKA